MADKAKIVEGLQRVQSLLYDSRNSIGDMVLPYREPKLQLAGVYDKLVQSEDILEAILDEEFWG